MPIASMAVFLFLEVIMKSKLFRFFQHIFFSLIYLLFFIVVCFAFKAIFQAIWNPSLITENRLEVFRAVGPILSGLGTFGLMLVAAYKLPKELGKLDDEVKTLSTKINDQTEDKKESRIESANAKKSEAAAFILESVYKIFGKGQVIDFLCDPFFEIGGEEKTPQELYMQRLQQCRPDISNYSEAKIKCNIYFKDAYTKMEILDKECLTPVIQNFNKLIICLSKSSMGEVIGKLQENLMELKKYPRQTHIDKIDEMLSPQLNS